MFTLKIKSPLTGGNVLDYKKRYMELLLEDKLGLECEPNSEFSTLVSFMVIVYKVG